MIPEALRSFWSRRVDWSSDLQVEQDLWLHLFLVGLYSRPELREELVFWGGTALHLLHLAGSDGHRMRYSEDLDFLRKTPGGIGPVLTPLGEMIESGGLQYTYETRTTFPKAWAAIPTSLRDVPLKVKLEFNTWERDLALGIEVHELAVSIPEELDVPGWPAGVVYISTPRLEEQAAFKVRALWERNKGRDLFDLWAAVTRGGADVEVIATVFNDNYRKDGFDPVRLLANLRGRLAEGAFESDLKPFVRSWPPYEYDPALAVDLVSEEIVARLT